MYTINMPNPRILLTCLSRSTHYHCISRAVDRDFKFADHERDVFRKILRQVEAFSGVRVVTWTILSNHFHVLLEVPARPEEPLSDGQILERCRALYSSDAMIAIEWEFDQARSRSGTALENLRQKYLHRMWDLSEFMKTLKQKFSSWFNRKHERVGTLWESRFKSVIVEGHWHSLLKIAAYIDLNAVRAGLVEDPKDYRWCGYSEAVAGDKLARCGLATALDLEKPTAFWREIGPRYRKILFGIGEGNSARAGISREEVAKVFEAGGKLSLPQLLRCRIRHFTDGLAVGSAEFIGRVFTANRQAFSEKRQTAACKLKGGDWDELCCARNLRIEPISHGGDG
ncbi:MAG: putative transposase [Verrucomicrobiales bacterium]|jgi:putative transposase